MFVQTKNIHIQYKHFTSKFVLFCIKTGYCMTVCKKECLYTYNYVNFTEKHSLDVQLMHRAYTYVYASPIVQPETMFSDCSCIRASDHACVQIVDDTVK